MQHNTCNLIGFVKWIYGSFYNKLVDKYKHHLMFWPIILRVDEDGYYYFKCVKE